MFSMADMYAVDETVVWLDTPGSTTVGRIGDSSVPIHNTGHDKSRITVCQPRQMEQNFPQ